MIVHRSAFAKLLKTINLMNEWANLNYFYYNRVDTWRTAANFARPHSGPSFTPL